MVHRSGNRVPPPLKISVWRVAANIALYRKMCLTTNLRLRKQMATFPTLRAIDNGRLSAPVSGLSALGLSMLTLHLGVHLELHLAIGCRA